MASRFGWNDNGGSALGDVAKALAGRAFGAAPALVYQISPAKTVVDASKGDTFFLKMAATSVVKIGNPTNYDEGSELLFIVNGVTSFGTIVWDTLYRLQVGAFATFSTAKVKGIAFKYSSALGKFVEIYRLGGPATAGGF